LNQDAVERLERAAFLCQTCSFIEASAIFETFDEYIRRKPVVQIEYDQMLSQQAKYSAAHVHLLRVIDRRKTDESSEDLPEYSLIRLMLARAEMHV